MSDVQEGDDVRALQAALEQQHAQTLHELRAAAGEVAEVRRAAAEREASLEAEVVAARARIHELEQALQRRRGPLARLAGRLARPRSDG